MKTKTEQKNLKEIYEDHLKQKPKQYLKFYEEINCGLETDEYIDWKIKGKMLDDAVKIPKILRKEILDTLRSGLSIGEVGEKLEIDSEVVSTVLYYNITDVKILRSESI